MPDQVAFAIRNVGGGKAMLEVLISIIDLLSYFSLYVHSKEADLVDKGIAIVSLFYPGPVTYQGYPVGLNFMQLGGGKHTASQT